MTSPVQTHPRLPVRSKARRNILTGLTAGLTVGLTLLTLMACAGTPAQTPTTASSEQTITISPDNISVSTPAAVTFQSWRFRWDPAFQGLQEGWYGPLDHEDNWGPVKVPAYWSNTWIQHYEGFGWYRVDFDVPADCQGHSLQLTFGAVDEQAWVFINGRTVGEHTVASENATFDKLWDKPFTLHVPAQHLKPGQRNLMAVLVHSAAGDGGIWLPVVATLLPPETTAKQATTCAD